MEFLRVQSAGSEANGTAVNGTTSLEFCPGKHLAKPRFIQDLSRIRPQMMQKVLSSIGLPEDKKADFTHVNRQAEGFHGQPEAPSHLMELFPVSTGFGSNPSVIETDITLPFATGKTDPDSSKSVLAKAPEQPSTDQLTIFYNGAVIVYDVPAEKAQAIMKLASANSSSNTKTSITSSKTEQISKPLPSNPPSKAVNENQARRPPVGLEIVRKLSLQRFLQKRKERINTVAPYTTMQEKATLPSKVREESEDQIFLSLTCL